MPSSFLQEEALAEVFICCLTLSLDQSAIRRQTRQRLHSASPFTPA